MSGETDQTPEPEEKSKTPNAKAFDKTIGENRHYIFLKWVFFPDGKHLANGWFVILLLLIAFASGGYGIGYEVKAYFANSEYTTLSDKLANLNDEYSDLNGKYLDAKQERDKYQQLLAPFEAAALKLNTNAPSNEQLELFASQLTTISTNLLNALSLDKPHFKLMLNGRFITNNSTVDMRDTRQLKIVVKNDSLITAHNLTVYFMAPTGIDATNIIVDNQWVKEPPGREIINDELGGKTIYNEWSWFCQNEVGGGVSWYLNTIEFATNINHEVIPVVKVEFEVYSMGSTNQQFIESLIFK